MAKVRELKKDIDTVVADIVFRCYCFSQENKDVEEKAVWSIAEKALNFQIELRKRADHPDAKDNKVLVRKYYKKLVADLLECHQNSIKELEQLKPE